MSPFRTLSVASLAVAAAATSLAAQGHPLAGAWDIEYERGMRMENGEATPILGKATLTLELRGDSLVGTLVRPAAPEQPAPPPERISARGTATGAEFVVKTQLTMNLNGEVSTHDAVMTWTLTATGDVLEGTMQRTITGMESMASRSRVKGVRIKS